MGRNRRKIAMTAAVVLLSARAAPTRAGPNSVVVSPGIGLTVDQPAIGHFAVVTLDGSPRSAQAHFGSFTVTDARGSGDGWAVTIQASPSRAGGGPGYHSGGTATAARSLTLPALTVTAEGTDSPVPDVTAGPYTLDGPAVIVAQAHPGTGMGRYTFTPTAGLHVTVPPGAGTGMYRGVVSVSVTSGP